MAKASRVTKSVIHHKDGSLWGKGSSKDGEMHGYWEWFRKDGSLMRTGTLAHGVQVGEWTTYAKDGSIVKVTAMKPKRS